MKKVFLLLVLVIHFSNLFSQLFSSSKGDMRTYKWRRSQNDSLGKAQSMFESKNYTLALPIFQKILDEHPTEMYLKYVVGVCGLYRSDAQEKSLEYLLEVYSKNKKVEDIEYDLARAYHFNYKFDEALGMIDLLMKKKNISDEQKRDAQKLIEYCNYGKTLMATPLNAKITNLGKIVNSEYNEFLPVLSSDESFMAFTYAGVKSTGGLQDGLLHHDSLGDYYEDIYITHKVNGNWVTPVSVGENINTNATEVAIGMSNDGQKLFIFKDDGTSSGDIYMSKLEGKQWSEPVKLRGEINSPYWESNVSLSADEQTIYFASVRPGGYGGKDIYKAHLQEDGSWGNVQNLGLGVNTTSDDDSPFLHPDGKTLFFVSNGFKSMGGNDIFYTQQNPIDSSWAEPKNIGYPINTPDDDDYFMINESGTRGYFAGGKANGVGLSDLYSVDMPAEFFKPVVITVKGKTTADDKPVQAKVQVDIVSKNKLFGNYLSYAGTGNYLVNVPPGFNYKFTFKATGFPDEIRNVDATGIKAYTENALDVKFITKKDTVIPEAKALAALTDGNKNASTKNETAKTAEIKASNSSSKNETLKTESTAKNTASSSEKVNTAKTTPEAIHKVEEEMAAKIGNASKQDLVFKVQVGAFKSVESFDFKSLRKFGKDAEKEVTENGLTTITIGKFATLNEAVEFRRKVQQEGKPDAFVISKYKGKRLYIGDLIKMGLVKP